MSSPSAQNNRTYFMGSPPLIRRMGDRDPDTPDQGGPDPLQDPFVRDIADGRRGVLELPGRPGPFRQASPRTGLRCSPVRYPEPARSIGQARTEATGFVS